MTTILPTNSLAASNQAFACAALARPSAGMSHVDGDSALAGRCVR